MRRVFEVEIKGEFEIWHKFPIYIMVKYNSGSRHFGNNQYIERLTEDDLIVNFITF